MPQTQEEEDRREVDFSDWLTVLAFVLCTAFLVCQIMGTVFLILAPKKKIAHYCWPRLVLVTGLFVCATIAVIVMGVYFSGKSALMNDALISVYEYFFDDNLNVNEKRELQGELKYYAGAFLALVIVFWLYTLFEFLLLRKMHNELKNQYSAAPTQEPSAPPAFNPDFHAHKA